MSDIEEKDEYEYSSGFICTQSSLCAILRDYTDEARRLNLVFTFDIAPKWFGKARVDYEAEGKLRDIQDFVIWESGYTSPHGATSLKKHL